MSVQAPEVKNGTNVDCNLAPKPGCKNSKKKLNLGFFYIYLRPPIILYWIMY